MSKWPLRKSKNFIRLIDARLQAVSSRNMYSEQGLEALIRPSFGQVCHSLMIVSNCRPGSAQAQAEKLIWSQRSLALTILQGLGSRPSLAALAFSVRQTSGHSPSCKRASMKALGTRTELLEFCPETVT